MKALRFRASPLVLFAVTVMALLDRTGTCFATLAAASLHECGHLAAARLLHIPAKCIRFDFLGAHLSLRSNLYSFGTEWLLCAAGPAASLLVSAAAAPLWGLLPIARVFSGASIVLGVLNLLPIRGFDGGRMLECTLSRFFSERLATDALTLLSFLFLFLLWAVSVYFLLRASDGISLFVFSGSLLLRFFDGEWDIFSSD